MINGFHVEKSTPLALGGSVLLHNDTVKQALLAAVDFNFSLKESSHPVEYAAVLLYQNHQINGEDTHVV